MKLEQLFLLHLMAGAGVAVCVYLSCTERAAALVSDSGRNCLLAAVPAVAARAPAAG